MKKHPAALCATRSQELRSSTLWKEGGGVWGRVIGTPLWNLIFSMELQVGDSKRLVVGHGEMSFGGGGPRGVLVHALRARALVLLLRGHAGRHCG